jgi:hypothetical protein
VETRCPPSASCSYRTLSPAPAGSGGLPLDVRGKREEAFHVDDGRIEVLLPRETLGYGLDDHVHVRGEAGFDIGIQGDQLHERVGALERLEEAELGHLPRHLVDRLVVEHVIRAGDAPRGGHRDLEPARGDLVHGESSIRLVRLRVRRAAAGDECQDGDESRQQPLERAIGGLAHRLDSWPRR